jgi:antitoxin ParD1/3/4
MSVKASVSISESQDAFARGLVADGKYSSLSAVVQRGLEMVRTETELQEAETAALRQLLTARAKGPFLTMEESRKETEAMLARRRKELGV